MRGQSWEQWTKTKTPPPIDSSIDRLYKRNHSKHPLLLLGRGADGSPVYLTEEERKAHTHIIGTTQEGKSRFLEHLVRRDIKLGNGLVFIDPSHNGNTVNRILGYCEYIGFKKVLLIDPAHHHEHNKIVPLNPFYKYRQPSTIHVQSIMEVLFDMQNMAHFAFIGEYLPALLGVLHDADMSLYESIYFSERDNRMYQNVRDEILDRAGESHDRIKIESAFITPTKFQQFGSTVRRFNILNQHETLKLMFGTKEHIDFPKLVRDGWVVLVNVSRGFELTKMHSKLLATAVINELIFTITRLTKKGWKGRYYLYIDEAGEYANDQLADLLELKSQAGLAVVIAHQLLDQFKDARIRRAITGMTKIKVAFYQPDPDDRMRTVKTLYGGELEDRQVSYALKHLKKQQAVVMPNKQEPQIIWIPDVKEYKVSKSFIKKLYEAPFYLNPKEVEEEINARIITGTSNQSSQKRAASSDKSSGSSSSSRRGDGNSAGKARLEELRKNKRAATDNPEEPKTSD